jgi:hypothetical protein
MKFILARHYDPQERFDIITRSIGNSIYNGVDDLYAQILNQASSKLALTVQKSLIDSG